jgi:hypothetical protein
LKNVINYTEDDDEDNKRIYEELMRNVISSQSRIMQGQGEGNSSTLGKPDIVDVLLDRMNSGQSTSKREKRLTASSPLAPAQQDYLSPLAHA